MTNQELYEYGEWLREEDRRLRAERDKIVKYGFISWMVVCGLTIAAMIAVVVGALISEGLK